jgi:hypothetical protein
MNIRLDHPWAITRTAEGCQEHEDRLITARRPAAMDGNAVKLRWFGERADQAILPSAAIRKTGDLALLLGCRQAHSPRNRDPLGVRCSSASAIGGHQRADSNTQRSL